MVPPASHRIPRAPRYSGSVCSLLTSLTGLLPSPVPLSFGIQLVVRFSLTARNPERPETLGLASFLFARRYYGNRFFILLLRVLICFSSPGALLYVYLIQHRVAGHYSGWVPPFGYPWINAYLQLPMAFRSLLRPSSAISAMASTMCSY